MGSVVMRTELLACASAESEDEWNSLKMETVALPNSHTVVNQEAHNWIQ
jgi:hypothetical protein